MVYERDVVDGLPALFMAHLGILCAVGTPAPDTGRYQHSACADTKVLNKREMVAPCSNPDCRDKGAKWVLQEKHEGMAKNVVTNAAKN